LKRVHFLEWKSFLVAIIVLKILNFNVSFLQISLFDK
jgi:hypothetical protein